MTAAARRITDKNTEDHTADREVCNAHELIVNATEKIDEKVSYQTFYWVMGAVGGLMLLLYSIANSGTNNSLTRADFETYRKEHKQDSDKAFAEFKEDMQQARKESEDRIISAIREIKRK